MLPVIKQKQTIQIRGRGFVAEDQTRGPLMDDAGTPAQGAMFDGSRVLDQGDSEILT